MTEIKETRSGIYGIHLATTINWLINNLPKDIQDNYRSRLIKELKNYSTEKESKLEEITNVANPVYLASIIKEGLHLMYQKRTSMRALEALISELKR